MKLVVVPLPATDDLTEISRTRRRLGASWRVSTRIMREHVRARPTLRSDISDPDARVGLVAPVGADEVRGQRLDLMGVA